jgi:pectate lyase
MMARNRTQAAVLIVLGLLMSQTLAAEAAPRAFPGAVGFGASATGWTGGEVIPVTTLADAGAGSLRACVEKGEMPRICVFQVSGTITLDTPLFFRSNLYVAGQTAPGQGIQIRLGKSRATPVIIKNASDVVVRFLKVRPGPSEQPSSSVDAVTLENATRVYLDHLSLMFSTDENLGIHVSRERSSDITVANSISAWALDRANHPKGRHSKGALICSGDGRDFDCGRVSLWRNLFAHNRDRNPDIYGNDDGPVEVVNSVFYNPISQFGEFRNYYGNAFIVYAGNVALTGPSTVDRRPAAVEAIMASDQYRLEVQVDDVLAIDRGRCNQDRPFRQVDADPGAEIIEGVTGTLSVPRVKASEVLDLVLEGVGDRLPSGRHRDSLDQQLVETVRDCKGKVIDSPSEVGGWPDLQPEERVVDSDGDGFPDAWEQSTTGLDAGQPDDPWQIVAGTDQSYIQLWLAELAGDRELDD